MYTFHISTILCFNNMWVDLASHKRYSYGPRFVPKAGGRGGGPRFARKVRLWTSFHNIICRYYNKKVSKICLSCYLLFFFIFPAFISPPAFGMKQGP